MKCHGVIDGIREDFKIPPEPGREIIYFNTTLNPDFLCASNNFLNRFVNTTDNDVFYLGKNDVKTVNL